MKSINVVGENLRRVRKAHKLTQAEFGEIIGKSQSTVYAYENGSVIPPFEVLNIVSQIFGVGLGHLMGIEWNPLSGRTIRELYSLYVDEVSEEDE